MLKKQDGYMFCLFSSQSRMHDNDLIDVNGSTAPTSFTCDVTH